MISRTQGTGMLPEERRSKIQNMLAHTPTVTISQLAEIFGTSEMTVRRDLDELEARGVCQRVHGGAVSVGALHYRAPAYPSYSQREQCQIREKVAIGRAAAALVEPGEVVAIDSGTTAAFMAQALRDCSSLTVITNSIRVLDQLLDATNIAVISPGGTLSPEERTTAGDVAFVGPTAAATLRGFRPSKAFITAAGLTLADGISNAGLFQAEIKRTLIDIADEAILIVDHTKFGRVAGFLVVGVNAFSRIITDTLAPAHDVETLRAMGIEVTLVEPAQDAQPLRPSILLRPALADRSNACAESRN